MFANFSFGPSSSTPHRPQSLECDYPPPSHDASRNDSLSPNSSRRASPSPFRTPARQECPHTRPTSRTHLSMSELSHKLSAHTLHGNRTLQPRHHHHHPQPRRHASGTSTPSPPPAADADETFFEVESPPPSSSGCRRRQRQLHSRMQCDPQHLKALADLVEGMVQAGSQCFVYEASGLASPREGGAGSATSLASSEGEEEDGDEAEEEEGDDDGAAGSRPGCRRNGTSTRGLARRVSVEWSGARTCVAKSVRVRKDVSRRGSAQVRRAER